MTHETHDLEIEILLDPIKESLLFEDEHPVGSHYICGTKDTDYDILVLFKEGTSFEDIKNLVQTEIPNVKFDYTMYKNLKGDFLSCKVRTEDSKRLVNLILTPKKSFYDNFVIAAKICKKLRLTNKKDRVFVHEMTIYGTSKVPEEPEAVEPQHAWNAPNDDPLGVLWENHEPHIRGVRGYLEREYKPQPIGHPYRKRIHGDGMLVKFNYGEMLAKYYPEER
jgi:hypothetical protein